jgi:DNA-binding response OmpR family regulator
MVVEDDDTIGRLLATGLQANGYEVRWQRTGRGALIEAAGNAFDLVVLDLGLPDVDGVEVCRELRVIQPATVIVMLTARQDEIDVVAGLESGADDYLTKPFGMVSVLARIRAHLRRSAFAVGSQPVDDIDVGSLHIDVGARTCSVDGVPVALRAKEFDLLLRLAQDAGSAVSRGQLMSDVWDENWFGSTKTLDVHIASLRRKLGEALEDGALQAPPAITTLRGHGYRLEAA